MNVIEINQKLIKIKNSEIGIHGFLDLIILIERKIRHFYPSEDLKSFKTYFNEINLPKEDKKEFIILRNRIVHGVEGIEDQININEVWIKEKIIPAVLDFQPFQRIDKVKQTHETILNRLIQIARSINSDVKKDVLVSFGQSRRRADLIIQYRGVDFVIEVKSRESVEIQLMGLQQLTSLMLAYGSKYGVLVSPGNYKNTQVKQYRDQDLEILIFGVDNDEKILIDWIRSHVTV